MPSPAPSHHSIHSAREAIVRMVKRNEKALLGPALAEWTATHAVHDPNPHATEEKWYQAACHKHGLGVIQLLSDAGIGLHSWVPVSTALERGLDDVAFAMAKINPRLAPLDPGRRKTTHVLVEAARRGRVDALDALFDRPDKADEEVVRLGGTPDPAARANDVLMILARTNGDQVAHNLDAVVGFLVGRGGNPNYANAQGTSILDRSPLVYHAAKAGNAAMLQALLVHGGDLRHTQTVDSYMPHPFPNAMAAAIDGIGDTYYRNKQITPNQWQTMELLADVGLVMDPEGQKDLMRRLPGNVPPWERDKLMAVAERARAALAQQALDQQTVAVNSPSSRPRL